MTTTDKPKLSTPTDTAAPAEANPPKGSHPKRGRKKRVLGQGEGDYCIYEIAGPEHQGLPAGALLPIPLAPRFTDTVKAMRWIRNESGDLLTGKQIMIFRACEILSLTVQTKPTVVIQAKAKHTVVDPSA